MLTGELSFATIRATPIFFRYGGRGWLWRGPPHRVVAHVVAALLSRSGAAWLVHGDLDFVTTNRGVVMSMPHKTRPGVSSDIHTATLCVGGIAVDISTLDGLDFEGEPFVRDFCRCDFF